MFDPVKVANRVADRVQEQCCSLPKEFIAWFFTVVEAESRREFREYLEQVERDRKEAIEASHR